MRTATTFKAKCSLSEIMRRDETTLVLSRGRPVALVVPIAGVEVDQAFRTAVVDIVQNNGANK